MAFLKKGIVLALIALLYCGCKESSPTKPKDATPAVAKSLKRGIAFDLALTADFAAISGGVSWWYNWAPAANAKIQGNYNETYQMDFIPMLWGGNTSSSDMQKVKTFIVSHTEVKYLLVMNEPNLTNQANRTPAQAAGDWLKYEQVIADLAALGREVFLVGPAMTWGTMTNYADPVIWLDAFYTAYKSANNGREPKIDYLAFHWYDYGLSAQLDRLAKYNKKIWITEMANWNAQINSYAMQAQQMREMVAICESRQDVFMYAWFYGRGNFPDNHFTYLFTAQEGELSQLGELYIKLPYAK
jgi:hypothetical protein